MSNQDHINYLQSELDRAKQAGRPVIVVQTESNKDQDTYVNKTTGTVRVDLKGGTEPALEPKPAVAPEIPACDRPVAKDVGKVLRSNAEEREIKLVSGALRLDLF